MKLSTKIILPIILISALLILLNGCMGTVPDESPAYTPGTITGIIASPCCPTTSAGAVSNPPTDWCCLTNIYISCEKDFFLQDNIEVILTYGEDEVATTTTNEKGEYTFTEVLPVKNYVITALCPDYDDERPLVKDVATEVVEGETFDAEITDWVSTSLGLVVDYLVDNTTVLGPENIELDEVIADKCAFIHFPAFRTLVRYVRRVGEDCGNLNTDEDVQVALCKAAQEVGRIVIPDLDLGCYVGYTSPPPPVKYTLTTAVLPVDSGKVTGAGTYNKGVTATVTATPEPGWQFDKWTGSTVANSTSANTTILMNGSKSVTANFTEIPTYTVTYHGNGSTGGTVPVDGSSPYYAGVEVTVLAQGTMVKANYGFTGWNTESDGTGTAYAPAATFDMPASNVTLYAQWSEDTKYTVTYHGNGSTGGTVPVDGSSPYYAGAMVTVLDEGDMELAGGYIFTGWNTESDGTGTAYAPAATFDMPASNVNLYAQWVCDPCSGWNADITVYLWYYPLGTNAKNDPRIDVDGAITGPDCAEITEIDIEFVLYNNGGQVKETYLDTLTSQNNSFSVELDIDPASYNAGDNYKLFVELPECGLMMIIEGPVVEL